MRRGRRPLLAVAGCALAILAFTMPPSGGDKEFQLVPFAEIVALFLHPAHAGNTLDVLGNVLLFMPLGAALAFARAGSLRRAVAYGAAFSAAIEIVQIAIPGRWTSVDDLILNTTGTALGFLAWRRLRRRGGLLEGEERRGAGAAERGGLESR